MLFLTGHFTALFCYKPSCFSYENRGILKLVNMVIYIWKATRFVTKQGHCQPHFYSKARALSSQLSNHLNIDEKRNDVVASEDVIRDIPR